MINNDLKFLSDILNQKLEFKNISTTDKNYEYYQKNKNELKNSNIQQYSINDIKQSLEKCNNKKIILNSLKDFDITKLYKSQIHGLNHNIRVLLFAFIISEMEQLNEANFNIILDAAKYHDIGRINDLRDDKHGKRSSENLLFLKDKYSETDFNILKTIIECHSVDDNDFVSIARNNKIIEIDRCKKLLDILKDSDGLDRVRLEFPYIKIDLIRTETAKKLVLFAYELYSNYSTYIKRQGV